MKNKPVFTAMLLVALCAPGFAQMEKDAKKDEWVRPSISKVQDRQLTNQESELVPLAEAMPEDKYNFAPTSGEFKGVRTFAEQLKHVAAVNFLLASAITGEKRTDGAEDEKGPATVKTKAQVVEYLKNSYAAVHKALNTITDINATDAIANPFGQGKTTRLALSTIVVSHGFDHYGQLVVYLRMNGIVPPASR